MAKISELKEMIVDLKLDLIRANIPQGNCPYAYYQPTTKRDIDCNEIGCNECKRIFMEDMKRDIRKVVRKL